MAAGTQISIFPIPLQLLPGCQIHSENWWQCSSQLQLVSGLTARKIFLWFTARWCCGVPQPHKKLKANHPTHHWGPPYGARKVGNPLAGDHGNLTSELALGVQWSATRKVLVHVHCETFLGFFYKCWAWPYLGTALHELNIKPHTSSCTG